MPTGVPRIFSEEEISEILYLRSEGLSTAILGSIYDCDRAVISRMLDIIGAYSPLPKRGGREPFTDEEISEILYLRGEGLAVIPIGQIYGCDSSVILRVLKSIDAWYPLQNRGGYPPRMVFTDEEISEILYLRLSVGLSENKLGEIYGCHGTTITRKLKKINAYIPLRRGR